MIKEFREFALKGNAIDMAVGIILGAAFGTIVNSVVNDIIMPPIGLLLGQVDFSSLLWILKEGATPGPYATPLIAKTAGAVTINYGAFINSIISFLIVSFSVFLMVRYFNRLRDVFESEEKSSVSTCPECCLEVLKHAKRCPHCCSPIK